MVLNALGMRTSYQALLKLLETRPFGTPFRNLAKLQQIGVQVTFSELPLDEFAPYLTNNVAIIASLNTGDLTYWSTSVDHAVVVVGIDKVNVLIHDPGLSHGPIAVTQTEFALAQLEFDHLCALIRR